MKVAVIGAGAMGMLFGGRLARVGHDVMLIDVDAARVAAIDAHGVTENGAAVKCRAFLPGAAPPDMADLLIVFTKATHTVPAIRQNAALLRAGGVVLTLQNGLGNGAAIAAEVGADHVLVGITNWPADLKGHGEIHVGGSGMVKLWSFDGADRSVIHSIADALADAGLNASAEPSVDAAIWTKVIFNATLNGIAALTGLTVGEIGDIEPTRALAMRLVAEGVAIAGASGITIDEEEVRSSVSFALTHHRDHKPSMLQDVEAGRRTEVDAIQGALVDAAHHHGIAVPALDTCVALLRGIDARNARAS
ncbi:2-dehydropantoate 2-reductase [Novosphingobium sp. NBM11]|uniref:ketopantoate reductase family protein n=1 Tax=Novosphingobium sp. NBM11 TaxID=2596914 RepID=UPI00189276D5|nr:2-dehydropantoate 2-reductase [Novosphingobium sp. NBM11]MBF5091403.1 2-dehydropantoate 2-reductase [Novosphingobium sp. NBM11]